MKVRIILVRDKETKNTVRYAEHGTTVLGTVDRPGVIYVQKSAGLNSDAISVTIEAANVPEGATVGKRKANAPTAVMNPVTDFDPGF